MSVAAHKGKISIPLVLLHESAALLITVELKSGDTARGWLLKAEDSWNVQLKDVTLTNAEDGKERQLKTLYVRGDRIRFIILPDMLENAPMFDRVQLFKSSKGRKGGNPKGLNQGAKVKIMRRQEQEQQRQFQNLHHPPQQRQLQQRHNQQQQQRVPPPGGHHQQAPWQPNRR